MLRRILYSWVFKLQTYTSQGGTQENKKGLQPLTNNSQSHVPGCQGHSLRYANGEDAYRSGTIPVPAAPAPVWFGTGSTDVDSSVWIGWFPRIVQYSPVVVAVSLVKPHSQTVNLTKTTHLGVRVSDWPSKHSWLMYCQAFFWPGYFPFPGTGPVWARASSDWSGL